MGDFPVQWPLETAPGIKPQEGGGRLINVHVDRRGGELGPVWRRVPGAKVFARAPSVGAAAGHATALAESHIKSGVGGAIGTATAEAVGTGLPRAGAGSADGHSTAFGDGSD